MNTCMLRTTFYSCTNTASTGASYCLFKRICRIWPHIGTDKLSFDGGASHSMNTCMLRTSFHEYMHAAHHILLIHAAHHILMIRACYFADNAASAGSEYMLRTTFYCLVPTLLLIRALLCGQRRLLCDSVHTVPDWNKKIYAAPHILRIHACYAPISTNASAALRQRPQCARLAQHAAHHILLIHATQHILAASTTCPTGSTTRFSTPASTSFQARAF